MHRIGSEEEDDEMELDTSHVHALLRDAYLCTKHLMEVSRSGQSREHCCGSSSRQNLPIAQWRGVYWCMFMHNEIMMSSTYVREMISASGVLAA